MLFILRQLRRSFFQPGKLKTYVAYAVGEILLIVIGIMIAVQIGDWKEGRKQEGEVFLSLSDIKTDLENEFATLNDHLGEFEEKRIAVEALKGHFKNQSISEKEVEAHFGQLTYIFFFTPIRSSYESYKDGGLPLKNRDLKLKLIDYYEYQQVKLSNSADDHEWFFKTYYFPFQRKHMAETIFRNVGIPKDHADPQLKEDFLANTSSFDTLIGNSIKRITLLLETNVQLVDLIDEELEGML